MGKLDKDLVALVPDIHLPDEDAKAVEWCLDRIRVRRPGTIVLLGDVVDFFALSRFPKNLSGKRKLPEELTAGKKFFERLFAICGGARVLYKSGNHEDRLTTYLNKQAPELAELPQLAVPAQLGVEGRVEYISTHHVILQDVLIFHGRKFDGNVALSNLRKFRMSCAQGHSHRMSIVYMTDARGNLLSSAECGTLQQRTPGYAGVTDWTLGMAWIREGVVYLDPKEVQ